MEFKRCPSPICGRPFQINQFDTGFSIHTERGKLTCPHCGLLLSGEADSVFLTHALSVEEEALFNATYPTKDPISGGLV